MNIAMPSGLKLNSETKLIAREHIDDTEFKLTDKEYIEHKMSATLFLTKKSPGGIAFCRLAPQKIMQTHELMTVIFPSYDGLL